MATQPLPLFPLATIVFPGGRLALKIFEQRYLDLVKSCIADDLPFGVCGIREGHEVGTPAVPFSVGTRVRIVEWDMPQPGIFLIEAEGLDRFRIRTTTVQPDGLILADVQMLAPDPETPMLASHALAAEVLEYLIGEYGAARFPGSHRLDDAVWVGYRLAEILPIGTATRQELLEMYDPLERLDVLVGLLRQHMN